VHDRCGFTQAYGNIVTKAVLIQNDKDQRNRLQNSSEMVDPEFQRFGNSAVRMSTREPHTTAVGWFTARCAAPRGLPEQEGHGRRIASTSAAWPNVDRIQRLVALKILDSYAGGGKLSFAQNREDDWRWLALDVSGLEGSGNDGKSWLFATIRRYCAVWAIPSASCLKRGAAGRVNGIRVQNIAGSDEIQNRIRCGALDEALWGRYTGCFTGAIFRLEWEAERGCCAFTLRGSRMGKRCWRFCLGCLLPCPLTWSLW
jgi:hypothetical protein